MGKEEKDKDQPVDFIKRGVYNRNPLGSATFIGLRTLDIVLQYQILAHGWGSSLINKLGLATISPSIAPTHARVSTLDSLLGSLPLPRLILLAMAAGSTVKQIFWLTYLSKEEFPASSAVAVSAYNSFINTANSLLLTTAATSAGTSSSNVRIPGTEYSVSLPVAIGTILYIVGLATETISELQRKWFKDAPENNGKLCTTGLWSRARHVNYGGYTLWRTGYCLAGGGWTAALLMGTSQAWTFLNRSIITLEDYMKRKYEDQWEKYKADVPYSLFPGIY